MSRHTILPGHPLTALFLLHVGSMDARLIGLSVERHWKHTVRLTANLDDAGVVLIDCDRPGVEAAFEKLVPHPRTGVVCYAFHPKDHAARFPNRVILGKPLNLEALPAILAKAAADSARIIAAPPLRRLTSTPPPSPAEAAPAEIPPSLGHGLQTEDERDLCGAMDDLPPKPSYPLPDKLFFNPDEYLIGHLYRAIEQARSSGRPYLIAGLPRLIAIRPLPEPACITDFRNNQLRPLSMAQLPHSTARLIGTSTLGYVNGSETVSAAEDFLWNVAAWAARGRLPEGTDPYKPVRLRAWPNFTQVFMSPHALRISALWVRTWASPVEIAFRLGIPQRYVFSVYSSARFAGLIDSAAPVTAETKPTTNPSPDTSGTAADPAAEAAAQRQQRPSILSRILRKLLNAV